MSEFSKFCKDTDIKAEVVATGNDKASPTKRERCLGVAMMGVGVVAGIVGATVPGAQAGLMLAPALVAGGAVIATKGSAPPPGNTPAQARAAKIISSM